MIAKCWNICWIICRPCELHADKGYDFPFCRQACTVRHIEHRIARRGVDSSTHLGKHRWVVERTFAWFHRYRSLLVRYERRADIQLGGTPKFCVKSNECRNRAEFVWGGSGLTVCRLCLQHNAGGDGCQGRRSRSFKP